MTQALTAAQTDSVNYTLEMSFVWILEFIIRRCVKIPLPAL